LKDALRMGEIVSLRTAAVCLRKKDMFGIPFLCEMLVLECFSILVQVCVALSVKNLIGKC